MARRVAAHIRVECSGGVPGAFRYRGRRYGVVAVLAHWVEARPWWRGGSQSPMAPIVVWRVEAAQGRATAVGTYDLRESAGRWRLTRVAD